MKAISLFSGMGGDTLGMEKAGIEVVAFNDFNKKAIETHLHNFSSKLIDKELDITKIPDEAFLKYRGVINLIFAGFPCQGFSHGGKKLPADPRNTLFREFVRASRIISPEFIIGENVEGLLSRKTEAGENYIDVIKSEFENIGYKITYKVVKAEDYNVPQLRRRLIIVGVHESLDFTYNFLTPSKCNPTINFIEKTLKGSIEVESELLVNKTVTEVTINDNDNIVHPYIRSIINKEPEYNGKKFKSLLSYSKRESPIHLEMIDHTKPSKTIICTYNHQPRLLVPLKYENKYYVRPFNVNELKQIQGFPSDFTIKGSIKDQIIQIGNAVPPPIINIIVKPIIEYFDKQ